MAPSDFYHPQQETCEPYRLVLQHVRTRLSTTVKRAKALSQVWCLLFVFLYY